MMNWTRNFSCTSISKVFNFTAKLDMWVTWSRISWDQSTIFIVSSFMRLRTFDLQPNPTINSFLYYVLDIDDLTLSTVINLITFKLSLLDCSHILHINFSYYELSSIMAESPTSITMVKSNVIIPSVNRIFSDHETIELYDRVSKCKYICWSCKL